MSAAIRTSLKANGVKIVGDFAPDDPSNVPLQLQQFNEALSLKPDVIIYTAIAPEPSVGWPRPPMTPASRWLPPRCRSIPNTP